MAEATLAFVVRTPHETVAELAVRSLRVTSDTGQVGLRPRSEPALLAIEPGLVLAWTAEGLRFIATAGGVLRCDGARAVLLSPVAVVGDDAESVRRRLDEALATPSAAVELRRAIEQLEAGMLRELRTQTGPRAAARAESEP